MTDDVYVEKLTYRPGWLKIGHSGDPEKRLRAFKTGIGSDQGVILRVYPGGGYDLEQWFLKELEQVYERDRPHEIVRCDIRVVDLAASIGARNGIEIVARAVAEQRRQAEARQRLTEAQVKRELALLERDAARHAAQAARESEQQAQRSSQPRYERPLPRFPREIRR